jgi:hypothetical protein
MGSPSRLYRTFVDGDGVRWGVEARLLGEGADAIPVAFAFASQRGERRAFDGSAPECLSWEQFGDGDWCELLAAARLLRTAQPRAARRRYQVVERSGRR